MSDSRLSGAIPSFDRGGHLFHPNRNPFFRIQKLRPENPLLLAIIEKAESSSAAIIADFGDNRLPSIRNTFESLSNSKAHVRPRYGDSLMAFSILSQFFETNA